jgi:hypothetical protein
MREPIQFHIANSRWVDVIAKIHASRLNLPMTRRLLPRDGMGVTLFLLDLASSLGMICH